MSIRPPIVRKDGKLPLGLVSAPEPLSALEQAAYIKLASNLNNRLWRLNNLYWIVNAQGRRVKFKLNWAQKALISNLWYLNLILKARQLGMTTFICILFLDTCLFRDNTHCGIIAHNREDAEEFFANKVKYAYDNLPSAIKEGRLAPSDSSKKLSFNNGSSIRVGTSLRSGTFYMLHISEFGKICARYPQKAKEIVTGSINTVHAGQFIFIESTAEGRDGYFYKYCMEAIRRVQRGLKPNKMQFRFFFFPWWKHPEYVLEDNMPQSAEVKTYFDELEGQGIHLTRKQKNWYIAKKDTQEDDMMREFPSTPKEAFMASIVGAYYATQMLAIRRTKRIGKVPYDSLYPVNVFWDIGYNDAMSLWFHQRVGQENRLIRYFEGSGEGLEYYIKYIQDTKYIIGAHYMPHDSRKHSVQTGETFVQYAYKLGLTNIHIVERPKNPEEVLIQIQAVRFFLSTTYIDEEQCAKGIKCLDGYRKEWDPNIGDFKKTPLHSWHSNGADSLRSGAVGYKHIVEALAQDLVPEYAEDI